MTDWIIFFFLFYCVVCRHSYETFDGRSFFYPHFPCIRWCRISVYSRAGKIQIISNEKWKSCRNVSINILPYRYRTALKSRWLLRLNRKLIYRMITTTERWSWINPLQVIIVPVHRSSIRKRSTLIFGLYNTRCSSRQSSQPWAPIFSSW
jgi:hypothetical protein